MHKACITGDSGKLQFYNIFFTNINPDYQIYFLKIKHTKSVLDQKHALYTICKYDSIDNYDDTWYLM